MSMHFSGTAYVFGHDVNTDEIIPARFLTTSDPATLAASCMEDARPGFAAGIRAGSIMVAGRNFGCGSSREHAPLSIKAAGISCVIAESFARIFFRNAINIGLPIVECPEVTSLVAEGDMLSVDLEAGLLRLPSGEARTIAPFPPFMEAIIREGGWMPYLAAVYGKQGGAR
jgi:3-isopropylmalate/(R)-2-methylmalate dehydratase small subunit